MTATEVLRNEHNGILAMLDVLGALARAAEDKRLDQHDAEQAVDFFRVFADRCHHGKEERHLFPALAAAGVDGPLDVMLAEHEKGRSLLRKMAASLHEPTGKADADFAAAAADYQVLLTAHIAKENNVLFPMADRLLPEHVQRDLNEAYEAAEREEMGEGAHERYHAMIEEMTARYAPETGSTHAAGACAAGCGH